MAVRIVSVKFTTEYSWQDISAKGNWNTVKNTNADWKTLAQTAITGKPVKIEVEVTEGTWTSIKELFTSWNSVKSKFTNWLDLKNW